jgi:hypothetical protein
VNKAVQDIFSERDFEYIQKYALEHHEALKKTRPAHESGYGALQLKDTPELRMLHEKLLPLARKMFSNESLIPNWQCLDIHSGPQPTQTSKKFADDADYVISVVVYQHFAWPTSIGEERPLELGENEGLFFSADQAFVRSEFPDPFNNVLANAFFFFIQP